MDYFKWFASVCPLAPLSINRYYQLVNTVFIVFQKILFIVILMAVGVLVRKLKIIPDTTIKALSTLLIDVFWPVLIFSSITGNLTATDITDNMFLPLLAVLTALTGFFLALLVVKLMRYDGDEKKIFLYHGTINNFVFLVLPFVDMMIPGKGAGLLFIHNLGITILLWTLGISVLNPGTSFSEMRRNLLSPGLIATTGGIFLVMTGLNLHIPALISEAAGVLGSPALPVAMIIAGAQIYDMGKKALRFNMWNILTAIIRLVAVPGILLLVTFLLKTYTSISRDALVIFMLVNLMPVSLNSVSLAIRYKSDPGLATQGVVFTHLFSIITIAAFLPLIELILA
ncbi:MAG: AEC family transporter [Spirochaetales bacterium]|nr:AEC family transporter [Spirochaetales bacterium]